MDWYEAQTKHPAHIQISRHRILFCGPVLNGPFKDRQFVCTEPSCPVSRTGIIKRAVYDVHDECIGIGIMIFTDVGNWVWIS
jgi:hypothetical protein